MEKDIPDVTQMALLDLLNEEDQSVLAEAVRRLVAEVEAPGSGLAAGFSNRAGA